MSAEERRNQVVQSLSTQELQQMPHWSAYLSRLGGQVKQAVKPVDKPAVKPGWWAKVRQKTTAAALSEQPNVEVAAAVRRPIGDRRTRVRERRGNQPPAPPQAPLYARLTMGVWGYYFIAKLGMYWRGLIDFHVPENLFFAAFILLPMTFLRGVKAAVVAMLALAMLYYDSWLPPFSRVISQASLLSDFSPAYLVELLGRFFSWSAVGLLFGCWLVYWIISRWMRVGVLVVVAMLVVGVIQMMAVESDADKAMPDMNRVLHDFFAKEAERYVAFTTPQPDAVPFDVIFIHVCSLSWDDVLAVGLDSHPLWARFDILLTKFNSAASYSGPAAIHLLRAKCGQPRHGEMYEPAADKCYLMESLKMSGFEPDVALNHDGKFDNFLGQLKTDGRLDTPPMSDDGLTPVQYAFDKSPVYDDLSVLDRWLDNRQKSSSSRVALYYNTISMHDGNHLPGTSSLPNTQEAYKARLSRFLDETESFMQKLEKSGRRAVVVFVPEHGAALRGDKRQIAGLREIPTPAITIVPVGIKVIGAQRAGDTLSIDQPTSYLAISYVIERMLEQSPFANKTFSAAGYVEQLPTTEFVAQDEKMTVAEFGNHFYYTRGDKKWERYTEFDKPDAKP